MLRPVSSGDQVSKRDHPAPSEDTWIEELVDEHRAAVFSYARGLTRGDVGWAEDVVQETFLRAWRHRARMMPERGSVRGWLMRVAHNLVMDGYRLARMRRGELPLDEADEVALPESTDQILTAHVVGEALDRLSERHRNALEATYLSDRTAAQAALELNVPVGTIKSRVFYGLRMLRSMMRDAEAVAAA
jgi:RNA polymerase sigma-70 factor (ECF subfamily)